MKKSIKVLSVLLAMLMLFALVAACVPNKEEGDKPVEATDAPEKVEEPTAEPEPTEVPREPQRIVCMAPSMVEIVYALGLGEEIVGWSAYTDYPPEVTERSGWVPYAQYYGMNAADFDVEAELAKDVAVVSQFYDCNFEIIEKLEPTVIFGEGTAQQPLVDELKTKGLNAYNYTPSTIDEVYTMMVEMGEILGVKEYAQELVDGYYAEIEEIKAITANLTAVPTYFEIAHQMDYGEYGVFGPYTNASGTPFDDMIAIAGGTNVFGDLQGDYTQITFEEIVAKNPAVILSPYWPDAMDQEVTTIFEIMTRPGFDTVDAVKTGRVYYYDSSLMKRFGPRTITAIKKLAYLLHPYYFENPENSVSPWELGKIDVFEKAPKPLH